jgi:hypothetical protein
VCGVVIRGENSQRMDAAYLFICKGVYRRIFVIVVRSEEFNVVSRVEEGVQNDDLLDLPALLRAALVLAH